MTASPPPLPRPSRVRPRVRPARAAGAIAAACCLTALAALPAAASSGGGQGSSGSDARVAPGGSLLSEPGVQVRPHAGVPGLPSGLSALSWTVSDARTGQVLAAKDAHRRLPPASTLKTLFADTVLPRLPREATHKVTDSDLADLGEGSSLVGVQAGQTYTVADLWRGVFLSSGNDAVHVLAHMNGSVARTVAQMQAKAEMLGADDTHVVTPDGYDEPGQVSSAYDLAVFGRAGLADHDFAEYVSTATAQFPGGYDAHGTYVKSFGIRNTNRLLTGADGVTPYRGLIGVKNGYTTNAGNTLVAAARRGSRTLIVTVMNPQSGLPQAVYHEASSLLDWGFAAAGRTTSVGTLNAARPAGLRTGPPPAAAHTPTAPPATEPPSAHNQAADGSPTAWFVGGGLAVAAVVSVLVLRRRASVRPR
ncbi:D-alanyl-D-alanine carboxypeptidase family protein [Streptomyces polygonati]|uniref:D-alanyl-D-alanine carboxypeptidase family protein n=1 Tax=Streptomyces polygonati TaxID=1617087 RepID=A0ABV8HNU5_9ACTN